MQRSSRHQDTPLVTTPHSRRQVALADYEWADLIDNQDKVRMLADPTSTYAQAAAAGLGRSMDDVIIAASIGSANTGVAGATATALPSGQKIAHGSAGLTIAKLITAKKILDQNNIDPSIKRYIAVSPEQIEDLLNNTTVTSSDYNVVRALATGSIDSYVGFEFIVTNRLTDDGTSRQCFAWAEDGITLAVGADMNARIDERADKSYSTQVYASMSIGSTRMEEEKVVEIACNE